MAVCDSELPYDLAVQCPLVVRFSDLKLSSDAAAKSGVAGQPSDHQLSGKPSLQASEAVGKMRGAVVAAFINRDRTAPEEIVLDIDGWDDPTHGTATVELLSWLL
ncbi:MAG: transposase [Myxacorys californica WJT36-NPBG1]|jgi:hypothetical protein|nr:transposase [Myxacorys californica WJT36-NPBG1]